MPKVKIKNNREKIANLLLSIGCVNINFKKKFTLTSGKKSPVYVDCRKLISFPKEREIIITQLKEAKKGGAKTQPAPVIDKRYFECETIDIVNENIQ